MVNKIQLHKNYLVKGVRVVFPSYTTHISQIKGSKISTIHPSKVLHFALEHVLVTFHGLIKAGKETELQLPRLGISLVFVKWTFGNEGKFSKHLVFIKHNIQFSSASVISSLKKHIRCPENLGKSKANEPEKRNYRLPCHGFNLSSMRSSSWFPALATTPRQDRRSSQGSSCAATASESVRQC